jgi:hypothetical protein
MKEISMKISYLTSLKHDFVSKYQDVIHENKLPHITHKCDSGNEMLSMKTIYIASLLCVILVPEWYP